MYARIAVAVAMLAFAGPAAAHRFEAKLAPSAPPASVIASDMAWSCHDATCFADGLMADAPARICAHVARELGRVEAFTVDAKPLDADKLAKCNANAK